MLFPRPLKPRNSGHTRGLSFRSAQRMLLTLQEELPRVDLFLLLLITLVDWYVSSTLPSYVEESCTDMCNYTGGISHLLGHAQMIAEWLPHLFLARICARALTAVIVMNWGCVDLVVLCPELGDRLSEKQVSLTSKEAMRYVHRISARKVDTDSVKSVGCLLCFLLDTVVSWITALTCLQFNGEKQAGGVALISLLLLSATSGFHLMTLSLTKVSRKGGILVEKLHQHGLFHSPVTASGSTCSNCKSQFHVRSHREDSFQCLECNFVLCKTCFMTNSEERSEGVETVRTDTGLIPKQAFTSALYFYKAIKLVKPVWYLYLLSFFFVLARSVCSLGTTHLQMSVITALYNQNEEDFWFSCRMLLAITAIEVVLSSARSYTSGRCLGKVSPPVKLKLFNALLSQDMAFFDGTSDDQLISVFYHDVRVMLDAVRLSVDTALLRLVFLVGNLSMCLFVSWKLTLLACTTIYPSYYISGIYAPWLNHNGAVLNDFNRHAMRTAHETFKNIRTVRAFSTESRIYEQVAESIRRWGVRLEKSYLLHSVSRLCESGVTIVAEVGTYFVGGLLVLNRPSDLTARSLLEFQRYWNGFETAMMHIKSIKQTLKTSAKAAERSFTIMESLAYVDTDSGTVLNDADVKGRIEIEEVSFAYQLRPKAIVLKRLSLVVESGTAVAIVGKSGSGKSTLIKLLLRFYRLDHAPEEPETPSRTSTKTNAARTGQIVLDGRNINDINLPSLHGLIGYVGQEIELFATTILENIVYGLPESSFDFSDVVRACRDAHAEEFILSFPDKYNTRIGQHGVRLSGGQKQRISLARCFLRKPRIVLLDEPTASLDSESEARVQEGIERLRQSNVARTIIIVAHRLSTIKGADMIAVLDAGSIAEKGTHSELLAKGGLYSDLMKCQLG